MKTTEQKKDCIVEQLEKFLGDKMAVVGISGGIDSAVIAALCTEAVGLNNVYGVSLPYGKQDTSDAEFLARQLKIHFDTFDIKPAVDAIVPSSTFSKIVRGNIMARIRMTVLYAYANELRGIVVGTTNRSEAELGYYTKYGDGGVDVEPIADLWKREVYELGKLLSIPKSIMTKPPSACLWDGQTDEGEFGFTYDDIEKFFTNRVSELTPEAFGKIDKMAAYSEHKRHMPPAFKLE
jgi:NAD+ synthase